jgi:hypothetical protein
LAFLIAAGCCGQSYAPNIAPSREYLEGPTDDAVAHLDRARLTFRTDGFGYLPSLLELLGINPDTQALVFSKDSFQADKISPRNPRAIYFNDEVAVGFVPGGTGIEVAAVDPKLGVLFYSLDRTEAGEPRFVRQQVCLKCHQGPSTEGVPGIFIGSVFPNVLGTPAREGAIVTDHRTPFRDRWGGWYVNAAKGEQPDRANALAPDPADPTALEVFTPRFAATKYLQPTSDIVALMTLEHQTQMTNLLTRLAWEKDASRLNSEIQATVRYMVFADEAPLREPIEGVSTFMKTFPQHGPRDAAGRSLRDFDLKTRLFRYPLSYMIYSRAFDALPEAIRARLYRGIFEALNAAGRSEVWQIVRETKPDLPAMGGNAFLLPPKSPPSGRVGR